MPSETPKAPSLLVPTREPPPNVAMCHRFMIPTSYAEQTPGLNQMVMKQQMGFVPCIKEKCNLWNKEEKYLPQGVKGECWDITKARAQARLADLKWNEVVGSED